MTDTLTCRHCPTTIAVAGAPDDLFDWGIQRGWVITTRAYCPTHADISGALRNR
jgi:hypothetical protein